MGKMRPIDANALIEKSYEVGKWMPVRVVNVSDIENAETIEAEPVLRGIHVPHYETWCNSDGKPIKSLRDGYECPFCGDPDIKSFCPNCGAKMEADSK